MIDHGCAGGMFSPQPLELLKACVLRLVAEQADPGQDTERMQRHTIIARRSA